jgi:guanylate kinase
MLFLFPPALTSCSKVSVQNILSSRFKNHVLQGIEKRGDTSPASMRKRLDIAAVELEHARIPGFFDRVIVSGELEETYQNFKKAILESQDESQDGKM